MRNIFGDNSQDTKVSTKKKTKVTVKKETKKDLQACFDEYRNAKSDLLGGLATDIGGGQSFACFATSVILHTVFREKRLGDIVDYWTDRSGDGKIDGIAFAINDNIIHHPGKVEVFNERIEKIDLYFIQSKKHKSSAFSKTEFKKFANGVKVFVGEDGIDDPNPSYSMQAWKLLWDSIMKKISKIEKSERPKVYIHFYYATWAPKPDSYTFKEDEKKLKQEFKSQCGVTDVNFNWADGEYLNKNYISNDSRKKSSTGVTPRTKIRTVYLRLTNNNTEKTVRCYVYDSVTGVSNAQWPGVVMKTESDRYSYSIPQNISSPKVIFYIDSKNRLPGEHQEGLSFSNGKEFFLNLSPSSNDSSHRCKKPTTVRIRHDTGKIKRILGESPNLYGFIESDNNGDVYFNFGNIADYKKVQFLVVGRRVSFQFEKNSDTQNRCQWSVLGPTLDIVK